MDEYQLFGNQIGDMQNGVLVKLCLVCGALVGAIPRHVEFHNKLYVQAGIGDR